MQAGSPFSKLIVSVTLAAAFAAPASAGFISSATVDAGSQSGATDSAGVLAATPVTASLLDSFFGANSFAGSASADADYGILKASAEATLTNYQGVNYDASDPATATAGFGDGLTFTGGIGTGYLVLVFDIDGSATSSGDLPVPAVVQAQGIITVRTGTQNPFGGGIVNSTGFTNGFTYQSPGIAFTYGVQLDFSATLSAFFRVLDGSFSPGFVYSQTGSANFGSTATLSHLLIYEDLGLQNLATGVSVQSLSSTEYQVGPGAAVPEPGTLLLAGLGALLIAGRARLRRRQAH